MTADYEGLELLICTEVRTLIARHDAIAVRAMRAILYDIKIHKWCLSEERGNDVGDNAAISDWKTRYSWITTAEFFRIEKDYKKGVYGEVERKLYDFARNNISAIREIQEKLSNSKSKSLRAYGQNPVYALNYLILKRKSIHLQTEIGLQLDEIKKEAWYCGNPDIDCVTVDWAGKHATGWRDKYVNVLCFIVKIREDRFRGILGANEKVAAS